MGRAIEANRRSKANRLGAVDMAETRSTQCKICRHADRIKIDADLLKGIPTRKVAVKYGVSRSSLVRHQQAHIPASIAAAVRLTGDTTEALRRAAREELVIADPKGTGAAEISLGERLAQTIEEIVEEAKKIGAEARKRKDYGPAVSAQNVRLRGISVQINALLQLMEREERERQEPRAVEYVYVANRLFEHPHWPRFKSGLLKLFTDESASARAVEAYFEHADVDSSLWDTESASEEVINAD